eukprot:4826925-Lingulodinium_polyedra.AAC.1
MTGGRVRARLTQLVRSNPAIVSEVLDALGSDDADAGPTQEHLELARCSIRAARRSTCRAGCTLRASGR